VIVSVIRITSLPGTIFDFPIGKAIDSSNYLVKEIDGLGPPDTGLLLGDTASEGSVYQGRRPRGRRIVMTVGLRPKFRSGVTAGDIRTKLYELLDARTGNPITMLLRNEGNTTTLYTAKGYVTRIEPNIFSKDPEVIITFDALSPYLYSPTAVTLAPAAMNMTITNPGNADVGYYLKFTVNKTLAKMRFYRTAYTATFKIVYDFQVGDIFEMDSTYGVRKVKITRSGTAINLMRYVTTDASVSTDNSKFIELHPGINAISMESSDSLTATNISVSFTPRYLGV
jgi:hypothetical protein